MFSRVLVPLDGSPLAEAALPAASSIARALDVELHLVRVVPPPNVSLMADPNAPYLSPDLYDQLVEGGIAEARAYLHDLLPSLRGPKAITSTVSHGLPAEEIVALAGRVPGTLVVMSSHGRTGLGRALLGSVAGQVVREGESPVLLIHSGGGMEAGGTAERPIEQIVVALDGSAASEAIVEPVQSLASVLHANVLLVHVAPEPADGREADAAEQLARLAASLREAGIKVSTRTLTGAPADAIARLDGVTDRSVIAMATHARVGLDRLISGSVAGEVFRHVSSPVLLVRAHAGDLVG